MEAEWNSELVKTTMNMKNKMIAMAVGILMVCLLPVVASAQQQEWRSTSAMQPSSSVYAPQVTAVGAVSATEMATTTENYSPSGRPGSIKRSAITTDDDDEGWTGRTDTEGTDLSPIGDAVLPLTLMAMTFCGIIYLRRKEKQS